MSEQRPNPESLLGAIERTNAPRGRGRLRVFLGMCPGVGKTYSMLKAAREQANRGRRVAIGIVETHGRKETAELVAGFKVFARRESSYRETLISEMDLDAILRDKPQLVLVDELAHTNAPGSRHVKRYQDVQELLEAGLDVYTTLNIQHVESRNDQVAQITGVQVRETVPDSFLEEAVQIELVDLSPAELLHRLHEGKVYLGDRAVAAAQNFFREEHLLALRELSLRFTAERVDQDLKDQMTMKGIEGPWNTNERLLVAVSPSPYSPRLIRATRRMAYNLEAPWITLYVESGEPLKPEDQRLLQKNLALARELGAEVVTTPGDDVAQAIQKICSEKNVTQIVMGRPDRRFFRDILSRGTLLDQLVRTTSKIDVHVIRAERKPRYRGFHLQWPSFATGFFAYYNTGWFITAISFINYALLPYLGYRAMGSLFLVAILIVAALAPRGPILFAAMVSAFVWDFFFIPPQFTFTMNSWEDAMMVVLFFVTALVAGFLTSRIRSQEVILQTREERTRVLYELAQGLADAPTPDQIASVIISTVDRLFQGSCSLFLGDRTSVFDGKSHFGPPLSEKELAVVRWSFDNDKPAGWNTQTLASAGCLCLPVRGQSRVIGVLAFAPRPGTREFSVDKENFLLTIISQAAIAIERFQYGESAQSAKLYEASEKLHQTLLNSVSHELRTPITALIGTATALKDERTLSNPQARESLTDELVRSAQRLDRVVENLLDLSRLQKSGLQLRKEWFDLAELLREVRLNLRDELSSRKLDLVHDDSVLMEGDFQLLSHALNQIVLNAVKYSEPKTKIEVEIRREAEAAQISVRDEGRGIPENSGEKLLEKFYRAPGTPSGGLGLGLTIANNIVELHGGRISIKNRADTQGTEVKILLPLTPAPRALQEAVR